MSNFETVVKLLVEYKDIDPATVSEASTFEALGLDSLDLAELQMNLEDELNIQLDVSEDVKTIGQILEAIEAAQ